MFMERGHNLSHPKELHVLWELQLSPQQNCILCRKKIATSGYFMKKKQSQIKYTKQLHMSLWLLYVRTTSCIGETVRWLIGLIV